MATRPESPDDKTPGNKKPSAAKLLDSEFANNIKESAQQIWLAGLGAFSKAQAEGGKVFDTLVKDGVNLQKKTQSAAEEKFAEVGAKWPGVAAEMQGKAGQQWDKLESIFEERTARALKRLGVPSQKDIDDLSARVDALTEQVAKLSAARPTANRSAAKQQSVQPSSRQAAAGKTAVKKAAAKKAAAKRPARKPGG
jgi:poly(hydroxyalkanoate) granule-associated protein